MIMRQINKKDFEEVLKMMEVFYASPAVLHKASIEILKKDINDCIGDCPYVNGYVFEKEGQIAGYAMTATGYSTEFGCINIWIEDLYIKPEFRGKGIARMFFSNLENLYKDQHIRFKLEVEDENKNAIEVYKKSGFKPLLYNIMSKEI